MIERGKVQEIFSIVVVNSHSVMKVGLCETGRPRNDQMSC